MQRRDSVKSRATAEDLGWPQGFYFRVEVVETQRRFPLFGWSDSRLPTDRPQFASVDGKIARPLLDVTNELPSGMCQWVTDWEVYQGTDERDRFMNSNTKALGRFDDECWEYAVDFPRHYKPAFTKGIDWVRRRFWRRVLVVLVGANVRVPFKDDFKAIMSNEMLTPTTYAEESSLLAAGGKHRIFYEEIAVSKGGGRKRANLVPSAGSDGNMSFNGAFSAWGSVFDGRSRAGSIAPSVIDPDFDDCGDPNDAVSPAAAPATFVSGSGGLLVANNEHLARLQRKLRAQEAAARRTTETERKASIRQLLAQFMSSYLLAVNAQSRREQREKEERKQRIIDRWGYCSTGRSGVLSLSVVEARGVTDPTTFVEVSYTPHVAHSPVSKRPGQYAFSTTIMVLDDTHPVDITIYQSSALTVTASKALWRAALPLNQPFKTLRRFVRDDSMTYVEEGFIEQQTRPAKDDSSATGPALVLRWTFEVRDVEQGMLFCSSCGRSDALCICDADIKVGRQEKLRMLRAVRLRDEFLSRKAREERERVSGSDDGQRQRTLALALTKLEAAAVTAARGVLIHEREAWRALVDDYLTREVTIRLTYVLFAHARCRRHGTTYEDDEDEREPLELLESTDPEMFTISGAEDADRTLTLRYMDAWMMFTLRRRAERIVALREAAAEAAFVGGQEEVLEREETRLAFLEERLRKNRVDRAELRMMLGLDEGPERAEAAASPTQGGRRRQKAKEGCCPIQ